MKLAIAFLCLILLSGAVLGTLIEKHYVLDADFSTRNNIEAEGVSIIKNGENSYYVRNESETGGYIDLLLNRAAWFGNPNLRSISFYLNYSFEHDELENEVGDGFTISHYVSVRKGEDVVSELRFIYSMSDTTNLVQITSSYRVYDDEGNVDRYSTLWYYSNSTSESEGHIWVQNISIKITIYQSGESVAILNVIYSNETGDYKNHYATAQTTVLILGIADYTALRFFTRATNSIGSTIYHFSAMGRVISESGGGLTGGVDMNTAIMMYAFVGLGVGTLLVATYVLFNRKF